MTGEYWGFMVKNQVSHQVSQFAKMRPLGSLRPLTCKSTAKRFKRLKKLKCPKILTQKRLRPLAGGYGEIKVKTVLPYDRAFP